MDLRQLREKAGLLNFEEAAFKIGISLSTLRAWESARGEPTTTEKIAKLMELYNCSFEEIKNAVIETKIKAAKDAENKGKKKLPTNKKAG